MSVFERAFVLTMAQMGGTSGLTLARLVQARLYACITRNFEEHWYDTMKIKNSLKSLKGRHRANRIVRRRGRVYIINKENPRFKARQG